MFALSNLNESLLCNMIEPMLRYFIGNGIIYGKYKRFFSPYKIDSIFF